MPCQLAKLAAYSRPAPYLKIRLLHGMVCSAADGADVSLALLRASQTTLEIPTPASDSTEQRRPAPLSQPPQASAVSSACFWKKLIQCHRRHQTAKLKFLHYTLYFLSGGGGMRRKVLPASSCRAAVVSCCLMHLIFNQNSTTENHSRTTNMQAHFLAPCKSQRWAGKVAEIWVHHHINIHFKDFVIKILFIEPESSISHNVTEFNAVASVKEEFSLLSSLKQCLVCLQQSTPRENAQRYFWNLT